MADLDAYVDDVLRDQDEILLREASECLRAGARRAAYITIWLATAESLRRKFFEAQTFDGQAGQIVGQIQHYEADHKAIDGLLIDKAADYGFVSDAEKQRLRHLYENRNVYGHPYEQSPSEAAVIAAAADALEIVLGRPTQLRHGYLQRQVARLTTDVTFLADHEPAVQAFADQVHTRSSADLRPWFVRKLLGELDSVFADPSQDLLQRRGVWFLRRLILAGPSIFNDWEPAEDLPDHPLVLPGLLATKDLFELISRHAQDIVVNVLCHNAPSDGRYFELLWSLKQDGALSQLHLDQFEALLEASPLTRLTGRGLPLVAYWRKIVSGLAMHSWDPQNRAIDVLRLAGPDQAADLSEAAQEELGRNIMQAAEGTAWRAINLLGELASAQPPWPEKLVEGAAIEPFLAEDGQIRLKTGEMARALRALRSLPAERRHAVIERIGDGIAAGDVRDAFQFSHERPDALLTLSCLAADTDLACVSEIANALEAKDLPDMNAES